MLFIAHLSTCGLGTLLGNKKRGAKIGYFTRVLSFLKIFPHRFSVTLK